MSHLLHEVREELDWAGREVEEAERQFAALEAELKIKLGASDSDTDRDAMIAEIEAKKGALNLNELYAILARAARRFSLLARVFEIGSQHTKTEDIVHALTDGLLFRLDDTGGATDDTIFRAAEALQNYFHVHFGDESDAALREVWLEVENALREKGRKI